MLWLLQITCSTFNCLLTEHQWYGSYGETWLASCNGLCDIHLQIFWNWQQVVINRGEQGLIWMLNLQTLCTGRNWRFAIHMLKHRVRTSLALHKIAKSDVPCQNSNTCRNCTTFVDEHSFIDACTTDLPYKSKCILCLKPKVSLILSKYIENLI